MLSKLWNFVFTFVLWRPWRREKGPFISLFKAPNIIWRIIYSFYAYSHLLSYNLHFYASFDEGSLLWRCLCWLWLDINILCSVNNFLFEKKFVLTYVGGIYHPYHTYQVCLCERELFISKFGKSKIEIPDLFPKYTLHVYLLISFLWS